MLLRVVCGHLMVGKTINEFYYTEGSHYLPYGEIIAVVEELYNERTQQWKFKLITQAGYVVWWSSNYSVTEHINFRNLQQL